MICPINNKTVQVLLEEYKKEIKDNEKYYIKEENIYGIKKEKILFFDKEYNAFIYYDPTRASDEKETIHSKLSLIEAKLDSTKYYSKKLKDAFDNYFEIEKKGKI